MMNETKQAIFYSMHSVGLICFVLSFIKISVSIFSLHPFIWIDFIVALCGYVESVVNVVPSAKK